MNQDKIGQFIKNIRKDNHLTQKEFADKYGVTYQAVSKWENGKNLPDISLIKQMSKDFNINIEDLLDGKFKQNKKKRNIIIICSILIISIILIICIINCIKGHQTFEFKTISTTCSEFKLTGSIAYNHNKSSIYISNINYCGKKDTTNYKKIECILYENNKNTETKISSYVSNKDTTLEKFLEKVTFKIDNYSRVCKEYSKNSLYLRINAVDKNNKTTTYKIDIELLDDCN